MLGEAQYLNWALVLDSTACLPSIDTLSSQDEDGKDFRFYYDIEHLKDSAPVRLNFAGVDDPLIMRKLGTVEPDNYWNSVCEGKMEQVISRPWHMDKIEAGSNLYISTNEPNTSFLDPLKARCSTHFLDEFKDLWYENRDWYAEIKKLNNEKPVELDGYVRMSIEDESVVDGKKED
ncbi:Hypothetical predicted protein [Olea europaea subsp. europaea]|uniref:DUF7075 domain-containing protein n=1 Tax=Olea europaea subsp. europaea TaxID=158383 RepID=A0A8S0SSQ7_OLEEU|nr:Hypothetical predicted protein [Olea europaea subsp. europaea]